MKSFLYKTSRRSHAVRERNEDIAQFEYTELLLIEIPIFEKSVLECESLFSPLTPSLIVEVDVSPLERDTIYHLEFDSESNAIKFRLR